MKNSPTITKTNVRTFAPILRGVSPERITDIYGAVLPDQFYTPAKESHERWTGERGLMLAVLQEAVQSYLKYSQATTQRGRRLFSETQAWFQNQDQDYLFSFENICGHLQLDPSYIRRGLESRSQPKRSPQEAVRATYRRASASNHRVRIAQAA